MSLDRLGAIVRRGAARAGVVAERARPAFDPLLALDSAASVAAARDIAPRRTPKGGSATAPVTPAAPARARQAASAPEPVSAQARPRPAEAPEVAPVARPAATPDRQAARPAPLAATVAPADIARADDGPGDPSGHPWAAAPLETPRDVAPASPQDVMRGPSPAPPDRATSDRASDRAVSASPPVAAIPAIAPVLPPPPRPAAQPQAGRTAPAEPRITIEQIEVVMAPAPKPAQTPAQTPRPAAAADRGFARYAAMRGARDRARW